MATHPFTHKDIFFCVSNSCFTITSERFSYHLDWTFRWSLDFFSSRQKTSFFQVYPTWPLLDSAFLEILFSRQIFHDEKIVRQPVWESLMLDFCMKTWNYGLLGTDGGIVCFVIFSSAFARGMHSDFLSCQYSCRINHFGRKGHHQDFENIFV